MSPSYFVRIQGRVLGPFETHQLILMRDRGQLKQFHELSADQQRWLPAGSFPELFAAAPVRSAPAPVERTLPLDDGPPPPPRSRSKAPPRPEREDRRPPRDDYDDDYAPPPRPGKQGGIPWAIVLSLVAIVGGGIALIVLLTTGKGTPVVDGNGNNSGEKVPAEVVDSLQEKKLSKAIGRVICGLEIIRVDGSRVERPLSSGSSFVISPEGYLLTNLHVVKDIDDLPRSAEIRKVNEDGKGKITPRAWVFFEEEKHPATLVHLSDDFDMAILKIDSPTPSVFQLSASADLARRTKVTACGFPGAAQTVVSDEESIRKLATEKLTFSKVEKYYNPRDFIFSLSEGPVSRVFEEETKRRWIQHGAAISHGYSGGPLLTEDGTVVGINTRVADAGISKEFQIAPGIGYALTLPQLRKEIDRVVKGVRWK